MFDGLTSRCTRPASWTAWSACASCTPMSTVRSGASRCSRSIKVPRSRPSIHCMARYSRPSCSPGIKYRDHVRMVNGSGKPRLPQETRAVVARLGDFRADYLKSHGPAENPLLGPVDKAHPTRADQLGDVVPAEGLASVQFRTHKSRPYISLRTCRWQSAHAPACRGSCVVARTVCHQHPARNRRPLFEAARRQQRCCRSAWRRPAGCRALKLTRYWSSSPGQTLQMTGADLVVLALPGEGHRQLTIRHAAGNGAGRASYRV